MYYCKKTKNICQDENSQISIIVGKISSIRDENFSQPNIIVRKILFKKTLR